MKFPVKTPEYQDLKTLSTEWSIVYGPLSSRRLGKSLGINLLGSGQKACSFDCPYCELGRTELRMKEMKTLVQYPSLELLKETFESEFKKAAADNQAIQHISIVGNGEPTLYPFFEEAVDLILEARNRHLPKARVAVLTNGTTLDNRHIISALNKLDDRMVKIDAGNEAMFKKINEPLVRLPLDRLLIGIRKLRDVTVQSMFVQGAIDNTSKKEVEDWIETVGLAQPRGVQIYTLDRVPPVTGLKKVPEEVLDVIAAQLERRTRIKAQVFF